MILPGKQPHPLTWGYNRDMFYDAHDADKRILNGSNISLLYNKGDSPLGNTFSQGTIAKQPLFNASGINGRGVIEVTSDGSGQRLVRNNSGSFRSIFYVSFVYFFPSIPSTTRHLYGVDFGFAIRIHDIIKTSAGRLQSKYTNFSGTTTTIQSPDALSAGRAYIIEVVHDPIAPFHGLYVDGVLKASTTSVTDSTDPRLYISLMNAGNQGLSLASRGRMGTFLFRQGSIPSDAVRAWRNRYLANRYNVAI
jgi:hypothetical protein